jgi:CheY-like chemotaxis protein
MSAGRSKSPKPSQPTLKVLVVENDASSGELLARVLRLHSCQADTAIGAEEGLKQLQQNRYDLLVTDLRMEPLDGVHLLTQLETLELTQQPRASVVLSGYLQDYYEKLQTIRHPLELFQKPLHLPSLVAVLDRLRN